MGWLVGQRSKDIAKTTTVKPMNRQNPQSGSIPDA
jgi:hypothetical protein